MATVDRPMRTLIKRPRRKRFPSPTSVLERAYRAISAATVSGPALMIKIINCGGRGRVFGGN